MESAQIHSPPPCARHGLLHPSVQGVQLKPVAPWLRGAKSLAGEGQQPPRGFWHNSADPRGQVDGAGSLSARHTGHLLRLCPGADVPHNSSQGALGLQGQEETLLAMRWQKG